MVGKRQMNLGGIQQKRTIGLMIETLHHQGNGKRAVCEIKMWKNMFEFSPC